MPSKNGDILSHVSIPIIHNYAIYVYNNDCVDIINDSAWQFTIEIFVIVSGYSWQSCPLQ